MTSPLIQPGAVLEETWRRLNAAASDRAHPMRLAAVATVTPSGRPSARLMLVRGADRALGSLWFHTDRRSSKLDDLAVLPRACVVVYDERDGVEIRLEGVVSVRADARTVSEHWEQTALAIPYLDSPADPSGPPAHPDPRLQRTLETIANGSVARARRSLVVLEFRIELIDWFQALGTGQRRTMLYAMTGWAPEEILP